MRAVNQTDHSFQTAVSFQEIADQFGFVGAVPTVSSGRYPVPQCPVRRISLSVNQHNVNQNDKNPADEHQSHPVGQNAARHLGR
jgi:hypothetical protein